jgi:vacuolar protein sorting-associated protein VTA1
VQGHAHFGSWGGEGEATPGSWSTAATPGTGQPYVDWEQGSPVTATNGGENSKRGNRPRSGSLSSTETARSSGSGGTSKKKAWVSEELDPQAANQYYSSQRNGTVSLDSPESSSDGSKKSVRFTPSVLGGLSPDGDLSPIQDAPGYPSVAANWPVNVPQSADHGSLSTHRPSQEEYVIAHTPPPAFVPDPPSHPRESVEEWAGVDLPPSTHITPPSPPQQPSNAYHHPSQPHLYHISAPQPIYAQPVPALQASAPPAPPVELELSPSIIAKAQKHCRFAISALDYEDAAQARRELRAALAVLGG